MIGGSGWGRDRENQVGVWGRARVGFRGQGGDWVRDTGCVNVGGGQGVGVGENQGGVWGETQGGYVGEHSQVGLG